MKFWAACKLGKGDYLQVKEKLFAQETVASLYAKIKEYQDDEALQKKFKSTSDVYDGRSFSSYPIVNDGVVKAIALV